MIAKRPRAKRGAAPAAFTIAGVVPERVVEPADAAEVAAELRAVAAAGEAVIVYGGGTLQRAANAPARYDVALSTRRLDAVAAYDPRELTIGLGSGVTLAALERTLAEHGQFVPLDAPFPARATAGGTLAAGWAGPRRAAYGRPRDLLIGATIALADGTLASSGGMVVKNVTGYDMGKLYVGSHGTLGALVRANFKALPAPAVRRLAVAPFDDDVRERAIAHALTLTLEPAALLVIDGFREAPGGGGTRVIVLMEGSEAVVDRTTRELRSALGAAGIAETRLLDGADAARTFQSAIDAYAAPGGEGSVTLLARGLPGDADARAHAVRDAVPGAETIADLRTGDVVARSTDAEATRAVLGRATVLTAAFGTAVDAWGEPPSSVATMRALKARFDPLGVLAPGRFVGGI
ncbi:MAG TPA: FAD-binding oxidoreductase [Candidatus Elarobacter sp.]|jgi:glycolate oxidase FAD binding subunit|nr:FAD-binding oxidoreductase [Candidatus Elarobacter sp.]